MVGEGIVDAAGFTGGVELAGFTAGVELEESVVCPGVGFESLFEMSCSADFRSTKLSSNFATRSSSDIVNPSDQFF